ncbi:MAG: HU family DNA-binding protein [Clostridiales Family XIII bacterium]|jgi:DNA-binding protein HU-beta|nr:HU family DNA-binding protein [Clostridiales Family XIII bacterium]
MATLNKADFVAAIAEKAELSKKDAATFVDAYTAVVTENLAAKNKISLIGFGNWETTEIAARTGRNPQTGEALKIKASTRPKFAAGKALKTAVNK